MCQNSVYVSEEERQKHLDAACNIDNGVESADGHYVIPTSGCPYHPGEDSCYCDECTCPCQD